MAEQLVILGAGQLGTAFAHRWRARHPDGRIVATVRQSSSRSRLEGTGAEVHEFDLLEDGGAPDWLAGTDLLLCTVAPGRQGSDAVWREGVPAFARRLRAGTDAHVVHISSTGVYREEDGNLVDEAAPVGGNARADALLAAERAFAAGPATILRCSGLVGPDRGPHRWIERLAGAERPGGDGWLNLVRVEDVLEVVERAFARRLEGVWNVSGGAVRRREFYDPLVDKAGLEPIRWVETPADRGRRVDSGRLERDFQFRCRPVLPGDLERSS